jgi:hypothetical protein
MENEKIIIRKPCSESWDQMKPNTEGRLCAACNTTVVDFTKMNPSEIKIYFQQLNGKKICGMYQSDQVKIERPKVHQKLVDWYAIFESRIHINSFFQSSMLAMISFLMLLVGCKSKTNYQKEITGVKLVKKKIDVKKEETYTMGTPPPQVIEKSYKLKKQEQCVPTNIEVSESVVVGEYLSPPFEEIATDTNIKTIEE